MVLAGMQYRLQSHIDQSHTCLDTYFVTTVHIYVCFVFRTLSNANESSSSEITPSFYYSLCFFQRMRRLHQVTFMNKEKEESWRIEQNDFASSYRRNRKFEFRSRLVLTTPSRFHRANTAQVGRIASQRRWQVLPRLQFVSRISGMRRKQRA